MNNILKLGEVAEFINGYAFKPSDWNDKGKKIIRIQNLTNKNKPFNMTDKVVSDKYLVKDGDILVSWSATLNVFTWEGDEALLNQHIFKVVPNEKIINSDFLKYALSKSISLMSKYSHGSTMKHINRKEFLSTDIYVPRLDKQKKIARILDMAQVTKNKRKESLSLLDDFLKSNFLEMFGDPIKNGKKLKKEKLINLCKIRRGASPRPIKNYLGGDIPWIKIGDATKGDNVYISKTKDYIIAEGSQKSVELEKGTLIFANCGVSLGFARILKINGCIHDGWLAFENFSKKINELYLLKLINYSTAFLRTLAPGGTQPNLNIRIMGDFEIILPPIEVQNKFADIVKQTELLKTKYQESEKELNNLFGSLMQRAFNGEL